MSSYTISKSKTGEAISYFGPQGARVANGDHKFYSEIRQAILDGEDDQKIVELFDMKTALLNRFERLGRRVTIKGAKLFFDGEALDGALAEVIVRAFTDGNQDFSRLVLFLEKLKANPNQEAVKSLFPWLAYLSFAIDADGDILAYKGVSATEESGVYKSCTSGNAISDGVEYKAQQIPQKLGSVVEMPRGNVTFDPSNGCAAGLHVGTYSYARQWGDTLILVKIDPTDVVSVPTHDQNQKLRTCRYTVIEVSPEERDNLFEAALPEGTTYEDEIDDGDDWVSPFAASDDEVEEGDDDWSDEEFTDDEVEDILAIDMNDLIEFVPDGEDDDENEEEDEFASRLAEVLALDRNDVRVLARVTGVRRRDSSGHNRTKSELAHLIVEAELRNAS